MARVMDKVASCALVQVGVANIREYETKHLKSAEVASSKRNKLILQVPFPTMLCAMCIFGLKIHTSSCIAIVRSPSLSCYAMLCRSSD